jgi:excisionase family DNA binding protein
VVVNSPYLTVQEVAAMARCEHRTVRRAIRSGELKASLIGGRWIVKVTAVEEWFEACANSRIAVPQASQPRAPRRPRVRARDNLPTRPGSIADLEAIRDRIIGP